MTIKKLELTVGLTTHDDFFWYTTAVNVKRFQRIFFDFTNPSFLSRQKPPRLRYFHRQFLIKPFFLNFFSFSFSFLRSHHFNHLCVFIFFFCFLFFLCLILILAFFFCCTSPFFSSLLFFLTLFMLRPHNEVLN